MLDWIRSADGEWCSLCDLDLRIDYFNGLSGVFMIWHTGEHPETLLIGSGNIRERLEQLRANPQIAVHHRHGLYVTWAESPTYRQPGIVAYLSQVLQPVMDESNPALKPIEVSLPHDDEEEAAEESQTFTDSSKSWV